MNVIIRVLQALLLVGFLAGCATTQTMSPEQTNLILPQTKKMTVAVCYFKPPSLFKGGEPAVREDFSEFVKSETSTFVDVLEKKMTEAGVDVSVTPSLDCNVENTTGEITLQVRFKMMIQGFGLAEDLIIAETFIKSPINDALSEGWRENINNILYPVRAEPMAEKISGIILLKIRAAQKPG